MVRRGSIISRVERLRRRAVFEHGPTVAYCDNCPTTHVFTRAALPGRSQSQPATAGSPAEEMPALASNSGLDSAAPVEPVPACHAGGRGFEFRRSGRKRPVKCLFLLSYPRTRLRARAANDRNATCAEPSIGPKLAQTCAWVVKFGQIQRESRMRFSLDLRRVIDRVGRHASAQVKIVWIDTFQPR